MAAIQLSLPDATRPRVLRYCKLCQQETSHEIQNAGGAGVSVCVSCLARALNFELDRD